jgi:hypothetical protein
LELIEQINPFALFKLEKPTRNTSILTICNLWRFTRHESGVVSHDEFLIKPKRWCQQSRTAFSKEMPIEDLTKSGMENYGYQLLVKAIQHILDECGFKRFRAPTQSHYYLIDGEDCSSEPHPVDMAERILEIYKTGNSPYCPSIKPTIDRRRAGDGAKKIHRALVNDILDKQLLSALTFASLGANKFDRYCYFASDRESVLRIFSERPNLLPLLGVIDQPMWKMPGLFGKRVWINTGSIKPLSSKPEFWLGTRHLHPRDKKKQKPNLYHFSGFSQNSAMRLIFRSSANVVAFWAKQGVRNTQISNISLANIQGEIHELVLLKMIEPHGLTEHFGVCTQTQALYRLFAVDCARTLETEGLEALKTKLGRESLAFVGDWLHSDNAGVQRICKRSTWSTILRRSIEWHATSQRGSSQLFWGSNIASETINGVTFVSLHNSELLSKEGMEMSHCVGGYAPLCFHNSYRVFSATDPNGVRTTLGIVTRGNGWSVDQHYGTNNSEISAETKAAGIALAKMYGTYKPRKKRKYKKESKTEIGKYAE